MKKQQRQNGNKPVTSSELKKALNNLQQSLNKKFAHIDGKFAQIDERFAIVDNKFKGLADLNAMNIDRAIAMLELKLDKRHNDMMNRIDAFLKRSEANEREILFLGRQHDDLAKYCHGKIAYPEYGRKL